jgi:hypothetical protein
MTFAVAEWTGRRIDGIKTVSTTATTDQVRTGNRPIQTTIGPTRGSDPDLTREPTMDRMRRWRAGAMIVLGPGLSLLTGCQTWVGGMTLPTGRYLEHRPQYFAPDPAFPLQKELATMERQNALAASQTRGLAGAGTVPLEGPVPVASVIDGR